MTKLLFMVVFSVAISMASLVRADVSYSTILQTNDSITGVRDLDNAGDVLLTGSYQTNGATEGLLVTGPLVAGTNYNYYYLTPTFSNETVTSSLYYGPDTALFDPGIGSNNIRAVGTYQYTGSSAYNDGVIYQGPLSGGGTWTQIDVPTNLTGASVLDTIPHSTMGDLVVGDYDLGTTNAPIMGSANAFVYNIATTNWTLFNFNNSMTNLSSAYGIWENGTNSDSYTIAGGALKDLISGVNEAYLVNYNSLSNSFTDLTYYSVAGLPTNIATHFEGITAVPGGYNVIATSVSVGGITNGAYFGFIATNNDGTFSTNVAWTDISVPGSSITTGDSVDTNTVMGIYQTTNTAPNVQSYIATVVPEPSTYALLGLGALVLVIAYRRKVV
jgi:hypothetical protein